MAVITIHWSAEVQPGTVTVVTLEDREAAQLAADAAEASALRAEQAAADAANSGGGGGGGGTGGGGNVYMIRYVSGAYPVRGSLPAGAVVVWIGPTPPTIGGQYAVAGTDQWFVAD